LIKLSKESVNLKIGIEIAQMKWKDKKKKEWEK
jgi:hypothetical protein